MKIKRVLIVGYGSMGKRHSRLARDLLPDADIRLLRHSACEFVPEYVNGCFLNIEDAVAFAPQIALLANPAPFHLGTAMPLAKCGAHLLIEKPLSDTAQDILRLIDICRIKNQVLMTGYNLRFLPSLARFRELIQAREWIGRVLSVRCEIGQYLPSWRPESDYRAGVSARKILGGGALLELSHEIDYLRWIFGEVDWVKATLLRQSDLEIDVEDTAHLILGFAGHLHSPSIVANLSMDFVRHDTTRTCVAIGTEGSLRWNGLTGEVALLKRDETVWQSVMNQPPQRDESYIAEWRHFLEVIAMKTPPLVTGEDGLRVMEIIEAARHAALTGCQQPMPHKRVTEGAVL
jgi:predicted dehydrogenase